MLRKFFSRTLRLEIDGDTRRFKKPGDLEFILGGKAVLSPQHTAALADMADDDLAREAERYGRMEERLSNVLSAAADSGGAGRLLDEIDLALVPEDNGWPGIIQRLRSLDGEFEAYKKAGLVRYLQYLSSAQALINNIHANRNLGRHAGYGGFDGARTTVVDDTARQTLLYSTVLDAATDGVEPKMMRLPKGESLALYFQPHQSFPLMMGKFSFLLISGDPFLLIDECGQDYKLRLGKNIIGRGVGNDVIVDSAFRSVSRKHLVIDTVTDGPVQLTDISTLGTFVPTDHVEKILH